MAKNPNGCRVEFAWGQFFKRGHFDDETCEEFAHEVGGLNDHGFCGNAPLKTNSSPL